MQYPKKCIALLLMPFFLACAAQGATLPAPQQEEQPTPQQTKTQSPAKLAATLPAESQKKAEPTSPTDDAPTGPKVNYPGIALDPSWTKEAYVITDSVVLGAKGHIHKNFKAIGWKSTVDGRPAMQIRAGIKEYLKTYSKLPPVAVVALGYNSLWEKDRKNFEKWAKRFDSDVEEMLKQLKARGVKKVVWVLLRELTPELVPPKNKTANSQFKTYAWYFPYVNERLKALRELHPEMALADWPSVSQTTALTYDAIHLNPKGAQAMTEEIIRAVGVEPPTPEMLISKKK